MAKSKKKKKGISTTGILVFILVAGLSLLLYPSFSDYWNSLHQSQAVAQYAEAVANMEDEKCTQLIAQAREYNDALLQKNNRYVMSDEEKAVYTSMLNLSNDGIMGYIEIPAIGCSLPVYHGVEESILQIAIGHIEWSSLPVGGTSTHSIVSGHRGLPSAKLFTDLDKLVEGDLFMFRILNETLTYEVDQILIVEPHEIDELQIEEGQDLCTLVTCTPYGINSHRILVRGHRVDNVEQSKVIRVTADAIQIDPLIMSPLVAAPILLVLFLQLMLGSPKKKL